MQAASLEQIAKTPTGPLSPAEETAVKIKAEEAGVQGRRAAVRYLGTINYHYYPEAETALIAALRADRNEFVRLEAALALCNRPIGSQRTMDVLTMVASGGDQDGNPREISEQVKKAALAALQQNQPKVAKLPDVQQPTARPAPANGLQLTSSNARPQAASRAIAAATPAERTFAETFGAPVKTTTSQAMAPPLATPSARSSGLRPIGAIPPE